MSHFVNFIPNFSNAHNLCYKSFFFNLTLIYDCSRKFNKQSLILESLIQIFDTTQDSQLVAILQC